MTTKKPKTLDVPIDQLTESYLNPRRTFDEGQLRELADSIAADGILQTLLVRPEPGKLPGYEVICGARRLRAATIAGLATLPVRVRYDLDDDGDALEAMITENSQRADVPPLEESDAYQALLGRGRDVAAIAAKLGRTESYVRARLRLQKLGPEGRLLLEHGLLTLTAGLALAQLDEEPQRQAIDHMGRWLRWPSTETMLEAGLEGDGYSVPSVASVAHVQRAIAGTKRTLTTARWSLDDGDLVEEAGPCTTCPRRTGAQVALFGEEGDDLCLDGGCWDRKSEAAWAVERARIEAAGGKVLEGDAAKAALGYGAHLRLESGLVGLDECPDVRGELDDDATEPPVWRGLLGAIPDSERTVLRTPRGDIVEAVDEAAAWKRIEDRYPESAATAARRREAVQGRKARSSGSGSGAASGPSASWKEQERQRQEKARLDAEVCRRCAATLRTAVASGPTELDVEVLRALVSVASSNASVSASSWVLASRGALKASSTVFDADLRIRKLAKEMDRGQLLALLVELVLAREFDQGGRAYGGNPLAPKAAPRQILNHYGVDVAHHRREAKKALKSKTTNGKKKAPKKTTAKKASKKAAKKAAKKSAKKHAPKGASA